MDARVKEWCRQECIRQHATTEQDFDNMIDAWHYAVGLSRSTGPLSVDRIRTIGQLVDPIANENRRFRTGPAVFMNGGISAQAGEIEYRLTNLIMWLRDEGLTPNEFYQSLMWIHPFKDGNGRVGALVYNMLNGTINYPVTPPEYGG